MLRIRRFGVIRTANTIALAGALTYAIGVVLFLGVMALGTRGFAESGWALILGSLLALLFYGVIGWVGVAIACVLYNAVAARFGGIALRIDQPAPRTTSSPSGPPGPDWR